jgi:hypothetical protein
MYGVLTVGSAALIVTLLGQIPYLFVNEIKAKRLAAQKSELKEQLKRKGSKEDEIYKELIKTNMGINKQVIIPLIIQFTIAIFAYGRLSLSNPMPLWFIWYIGFCVLFNRMWIKVIAMMF